MAKEKRGSTMTKKIEADLVEDYSVNEVMLRGRVSGDPSEKELPSATTWWSFASSYAEIIATEWIL